MPRMTDDQFKRLMDADHEPDAAICLHLVEAIPIDPSPGILPPAILVRIAGHTQLPEPHGMDEGHPDREIPDETLYTVDFVLNFGNAMGFMDTLQNAVGVLISEHMSGFLTEKLGGILSGSLPETAVMEFTEDEIDTPEFEEKTGSFLRDMFRSLLRDQEKPDGE